MSDHSEVLARKYRPKKFEDVIGQDSVSNTLSLALDTKRLSHAYLFSGLRGSGKTSTARIFSKALLCDHGPTSRPCDVCQNCTMANDNRHIDIIELDAASNRKIDDIRDIIEQSRYKPAIGRFKIFIIDEVHMLTKEAFNALLKTLEEPPEFVKFILATTDPLKLPATILSRTQHFRFKSVPKTAVINHLEYILNKEKIPYEIEALEIITRSGNGSLRDTLTILDQAIIYSKKRLNIASVTDMLGLIDPQYIDDLFTAIFQKDMTKIKSFVVDLDTYDTETVIDEIIVYLKDKLLQSDVKFSVLIVDRFFRVLNDAKFLLSINSDSGFVLMLTMLKMVEALKIKDINEMIEEIEQNIAKNTNVPKPIQSQPKIQPQQQIQNTTEDKFQRLIEAVYDRNTDIGDCFKNSVQFISYENNILSWKSNADEECKKRLKVGYSVIKHLVQEIFGINTTINLVQEQPQIIDQVHSITEHIQDNIEVIQNTTPHFQEEITQPVILAEEKKNLKIGTDIAFSNMDDVLSHDMVKDIRNLFGYNVEVFVKKTNE